MEFHARNTSLRHHYRPLSYELCYLCSYFNIYSYNRYDYLRALNILPRFTIKRWLSTSTDSTPSEFAGPNAYDLLRVSETSSFAEIKASFHKLAKETHPDVVQSQTDCDFSASKRFIQILAAYEILSDTDKRAHYDRYLLSQRVVLQRACNSTRGSIKMYSSESRGVQVQQMEVVEWLRWYRYAINEILAEKRVVEGSGYFDEIERDFYSAIHAAYYGPEVDSLDLLPDRFEAEERSVCETPEVLHLVSGRDLFGMVRIADKALELPNVCSEKLTSSSLNLCHFVDNIGPQTNCNAPNDRNYQIEAGGTNCLTSDAYKDLELHVAGRLVAVATRTPPSSSQIPDNESEDQIHVYLTSQEETDNCQGYSSNIHSIDSSNGSRIRLGTIKGLGTSPDEGTCNVYGDDGMKTHVIMKHRTLLVKHMHWYRVGDKVSVCECRCCRARLPPSKYWLFEPRCGTHDIGGWYVETFGRDRKGRTVPSQRYWDGINTSEQLQKRLHPAMYLLALAYRTLDIEDAKRRKQAMKDILETKMHRVLGWCKKLL